MPIIRPICPFAHAVRQLVVDRGLQWDHGPLLDLRRLVGGGRLLGLSPVDHLQMAGAVLPAGRHERRSLHL